MIDDRAVIVIGKVQTRMRAGADEDHFAACLDKVVFQRRQGCVSGVDQHLSL